MPNPSSLSLRIGCVGLIALWASLSACHSAENSNATKAIQVHTISELHAGQKLWQAQDQARRETYFYQAMYIKSTGEYEVTGVQVVQNRIHSRMYKNFFRDPASDHVRFFRTWHEESVNTGRNQLGARPYKMEELYAECEHDIFGGKKAADELRISYRPDGSLIFCQRQAAACRDDCSIGFYIDHIAYRRLDSKEQSRFLDEAFFKP
ncbi:MAG: hypothetical protein KDK39_02205 [Leptospiraceae bacterium]|nr:hypothetical protein [Leptospiraceae bacterium]